MINFQEGWRRYESNGFNEESPDQTDRGSAEAMNNCNYTGSKFPDKSGFNGYLLNHYPLNAVFS